MDDALDQDYRAAEDAVGEILKYYRVKPQEVKIMSKANE